MAVTVSPSVTELDVVIIGAGPAGLAAAIALSRSRPDLLERVVILEKEIFPRRKLCGGGLTEDAERLLDQLEIPFRDFPSVPSSNIQLRFHKFSFNFRSRPTALRIVDRMAFDEMVARAAIASGVRIQFGEPVIRATNQADHVLITTEKAVYKAKLALVANGSRSTFLPQNQGRNKAKVIEVLLRGGQYHHFSEPIFDVSAKSDGFNGYYWIFPSITNDEKTLNIGLYDANLYRRTKPAKMIPSLRNWAASYGLSFEDDQVSGAPINLLSGDATAQSNRVWYIGDAIGAEALLGEGISFALGSGLLAAEAIAGVNLDTQIPDFQRVYERSALRRALWRRALFAKIFYFFYWDWTTAALWRVFHPLINLIMRRYLMGWSKKNPPTG